MYPFHKLPPSEEPPPEEGTPYLDLMIAVSFVLLTLLIGLVVIIQVGRFWFPPAG